MYRVVHSFYKNINIAKREFTQIKKKWPEAVIENDSDGFNTIVLARVKTNTEALKILHEVFREGLWCGIENVE